MSEAAQAIAKYAPGARVEIRDEEWMIRSVHPTTTGGRALRVVGVSELVRGRSAMFLDELDDILVLDPRDTTLEQDASAGYRLSKLYIESLLRQSPPTTDELVIGHRGAMVEASYQRLPAAKALRQPRARILIADGVGLGKTIEVGVLLAELIRRGRGRRILVVALRSVLEQFQQELWARFTIPLVRLDSLGIARVQRKIPANVNPFHYYDRVIISIDTLKKDVKYRRYLSDCNWDAIVIDECQHVAERSTRGGQVSQRARRAKRLADTCDALSLVSATPHDGRPESFASLMRLLDPTAVLNPSAFTNEEIGGLYVRRFKKDIEHEVRESFQARRLVPHRVAATPAEDSLFAALSTSEFKTIRGGSALFQTLLRKAALSSSEALIATLEERLKHRRVNADTNEAAHDRALLRSLAKTAGATRAEAPSKLTALVSTLRAAGVHDFAADNRVVIFSERIKTLDMLAAALPKALGLKRSAFALFTGSTDDIRQQQLVKSFGSRDSALRVMLASDAAAEGINLHFYCHRLVHYDIPWSLITLEQRNGRVDRYGQRHQPEIHYLLTVPGDARHQGDVRVLDRLIEKEHEAHKNLGDVRSLLRLRDAAEEEAYIARGVAAGEDAATIIPELPSGETEEDFLAALTRAERERDATRGEVRVREPLTLYDDDLSFMAAGFEELATHYEDIERPTLHERVKGIEIQAPDDLKRRFELLPPELREGDHGRYKLTAARGFLMEEFQRARERRNAWIEWHLLWPLHPISEWLSDRLVAHMTRHAAPVVRVRAGLDPGYASFLIQGILSNHRSQAIVCRWFGVTLPCSDSAQAAGQPQIIDFESLVERLGLRGPLPDDGAPLETASLLGQRARAIEVALAEMNKARSERAAQLQGSVRAELLRLQAWAEERLEAIDRRIAAGGLRQARLRSLTLERERVEALSEKRKQSCREALATDASPYLRIAAVFVPAGHPSISR